MMEVSETTDDSICASRHPQSVSSRALFHRLAVASASDDAACIAYSLLLLQSTKSSLQSPKLTK